MSPTMLRVDSRLVHGQVIETWLPALKADSIVVIDEKTAGSPLARSAMKLALPPEVSLRVLSPEEADTSILDGGKRPLILVPSIAEAVRFVERQELSGESVVINVGVVHDMPDRRPIAPGVYLSAGEIDSLASLAARGLHVEVRSLPSQAPLAVDQARALYEKHGRRERGR